MNAKLAKAIRHAVRLRGLPDQAAKEMKKELKPAMTTAARREFMRQYLEHFDVVLANKGMLNETTTQDQVPVDNVEDVSQISVGEANALASTETAPETNQ